MMVTMVTTHDDRISLKTHSSFVFHMESHIICTCETVGGKKKEQEKRQQW